MTILAAAALSAFLAVRASAGEKRYPSPDGAFEAVVQSTGPGEAKYGDEESLFEIWTASGGRVFAKNYASDDGEHGSGIMQAAWTPDSRFFVLIRQYSGGHSPLMHPIDFWDRSSERLHSLDRSIGGVMGGFTLLAPDIVRGRKNGGDIDGVPFRVRLSRITGPPKERIEFLRRLWRVASEDPPAYGIEVIRGADGVRRASFSRRSGKELQALDALRLPALGKGERLVYFCKADGIDMLEGHDFSFGIAVFAPGATETRDVRKAWRIDWDALKIAEIPATRGARCLNEDDAD